MPSPFPGMDPYLEQPVFWSSFHTKLMVGIATAIAPRLRPKYYVDVETRTYTDETDTELLVGVPDALVLSRMGGALEPIAQPAGGTAVQVQVMPQVVQLPMPMEVRERYLQVREVGSDAVVAVIEVLSPANKRLGEGRRAYEGKRQRVLASLSHLVEIDLLRAGSPMPMALPGGGTVGQSHYRILVSRAPIRPQAELYAFGLQDAIPPFPLPLKPEDEDLVVDLQAIVQQIYELGSYDLRIDYQQPLPSLHSST